MTKTKNEPKEVLESYERWCDVCGKRVWIANPAEWVYKVKLKDTAKYGCSYSCYKELKARVDGAKKTTRKPSMMVVRKERSRA